MQNVQKVSLTGFRFILSSIASLILAISGGTAQAASAGTGSAYGLNISATVPLVAPLNVGPTPVVSGSALPDFNLAQTVVGVNATLTSVLAVNTGVINASTQSVLAQNSVQSTAEVNGLNVSILALALGANTVTSTATMSCNAGLRAVSGSTTIVGGTGTLAGITLPAPNTQISVLAGLATVFLNEQIVTPTGITVNAIRIQVNVLGVLTASVIIAQSQASIADCKPTVTVDVAPVINLANQTNYTVSGSCSAGSGNVAVTLPGATGSPQSVPCTAGGTYTATFDATGTPQGVVTVTATQTDGYGNTGTGTKDTFKDTIAPIVTVVTAPIINIANQTTYSGVTGTCSENGLPVTVTIGALTVTPAPVCAAGAWTATATNVSTLPDGVVTVTASQTDPSGNTGSGSRNTSKDATAPTVTVVTAPPINVGNQTTYGGVTGTCSENGSIVTVSIGGIAVVPPPTCTVNTWTASPVNASSLPDGTVIVTASQTDPAGNTGTGTLSTVKDATAPTVTVTTAPTINLGNQATYTGVTGTCSENGVIVSVNIGGISVASPTCTANAWTAPSTNVSSLPDGTVIVTASQTDIGGNTGSGTRNTTKDATAPVVTVATAPIINAANQAAYAGVTGTCSENGVAVSITVGGILTSPSPICTGNAWTAASVNVSALAEGVVVVTATQIDAAGNTGTGNRNTLKDLTAPLVTVATAPIILLANQASYTGVTGTCSENTLPVSVTIGGIAVAPPPICGAGAWTAGATNVTALPDGAVLVTASQTDAAGNTGSGSLNTSKNTSTPVVTVNTAPNINQANQASYAGVAGNCTESGLPVTVTIGAVPVVPPPTCAAGAWSAAATNVTALPDGAVVVTASQTSVVGNTGTGTRNTNKDATAPVVTVATAPFINAANQATYSGVTGACSENGLPVTVSVGSIAVVPSPICASGAWTATAVDATPLAQGAVLVTASQTDTFGNTGSGNRSTTKDTGVPVVTVVTAPSINFANQLAYVGVSGTCSENGLPVAVTIGSVSATPPPVCLINAWTAPAANVSSVPDGVVTVTAAQTDAAGNTGTGSKNTGKDATAPVVTVVIAPPINFTNQIAYGVSGACSENGLPVTVSIGSISVTPPTCVLSAWAVTAVNVSALPEGAVLVTASQTDAAGNTGSGNKSTLKDAAVPVVTVATAPVINVANQSAYTGVTGTCSENGLPVTVTIGSVSATPAPTCTANAWTAPSANVASLADGAVVVTASQTDAAGNTGSGTRNTSKDATAPVVTVTTAPIINAANQASYTGVTGTCSENALPVAVTIGGIAVSPPPTCAANAWTAASTNVTALAEGAVIVSASQTDSAGNTGSGTRNTSKDLTAPVVTVTTAPTINFANQATYSGVTGTCSENGLIVTITIGSVAVSPSPTCTAGTWTAPSNNVTALPEGAVVVTASQTDLAGNIGSGTRNTTKDVTAPVVTVTTAPAINLANQATYTGVTGTCTENTLPVTVTIGAVTVTPSPTCTANAWTAGAANVTTVPDGVVIVTASQTDAAGNTGSGTRNTNKDASAPIVTVTTAPPINTANQATYSGVTGTCSENGLPVTVSVGSVAVSPSPTCITGAWTAAAVNATPLAQGTVTVTASQTDAAGNTGSGTRDTVKDITAPVVTVTTAPAINVANQAAYTGVTGTCSENGLPVTITIGSINATPSPTCAGNAWTAPNANVSGLADGTVVVTASQTDAAGNTVSGARNTTKDATAPVVTVVTAPAVTAANQATYSGVTGACSENGLPVTVTVGSVAATPSPMCTASAWSAPPVDVTPLPNGPITVTGSQTDAAGNTGSGTKLTSKATAAAQFNIIGFAMRDVDGITNGIMDGPSTQLTNLYIYVVDGAGVVVGSTLVNIDGTYTVANVPNGTYRVVLSTVANQTLNPVTQLGADWVNTSEGFGIAGDGTPDGIVYNVVVADSNVTGVRFAIEQRPSGQSSMIASLANPGGTALLTVPARAFTTNASDPDGIIVGYNIVSFPSGVDAIRLSGTTYSAATFPAGGVLVTTSNVATIAVDPAGSDTAPVAVTIPFQVMDNANAPSATYTATLQLAAVVAADTAVPVPTLSPGWMAMLLLLVAMVGLRYGRVGFSRR